MPTKSSTSLRLQPSWQGAGHTRPIIDGNGLASVERRKAYSPISMPGAGFSWPRTMASQPRMSSPDGQLPWHGGVLWTYVGHLCEVSCTKILSVNESHWFSPSSKRRQVSLVFISSLGVAISYAPYFHALLIPWDRVCLMRGPQPQAASSSASSSSSSLSWPVRTIAFETSWWTLTIMSMSRP